jgi:filamentous hemagglutinin family protein
MLKLARLNNGILISSFTTVVSAGQVATDGSMGAATTLTGPNYNVSQDLGTTVGNNLFHSFGTFNLSQGDIATFTGADTVQNVISRVTDGNPSSIDGTIESQVGNANFFFINPAGVVFGQHATVNVPGDFHVSTANELRFADGTKYNLQTTHGSLTAAPPEAFGFLAATGNIVIEGGQLQFSEGSNVSFSGGSIISNNATIEVPQGSLQIYGQGNAVVNVPINGELPIGNGSIAINGGGWSVGGGNGGGSIVVSGGEVSIINGGVVASSTNGQGNAGFVNVNAANLLIDGQGNENFTGIASQANSNSTGDAGTINVVVTGNVQILNNGKISSNTFAQGNAGSVTLNVAGTLQILNGSGVSSSTRGQGDAGVVTVAAGNLIIDAGSFTKHLTGISSQANSNSTGNAGAVNVNVVGTLQILNGGEIASNTFATGNAGNITVAAGDLIIDGQEAAIFTGIASGVAPNATGNAGVIKINVAGTLQILHGGEITSSSFSQGNAGSIFVAATNVILDDHDSSYFTGITSGVAPNSSGNAGQIVITAANNLSIIGTAEITSANYGTGNAGSIIISANRLINMQHGSITTISNVGHGGDININAPIIRLHNGQITTSVEGEGGNGGDINLNGNFLVLDTGFIQANTAGADAKGGNIFVNMDGLFTNGGKVKIGGWKKEIFVPNSGKNIIQAAANARENYGNITFKNPKDDAASSIGADFNRLEPLKITKYPCEDFKHRASFHRKKVVILPNVE